MKKSSVTLIAGILLVISLTSAGCSAEKPVTAANVYAERNAAAAEKTQAEQAKKTEEELPAREDEMTQEESLLEKMTLKEKIYQMFIVTPEQLTGMTESYATIAGNMTKQALSEKPVGGLIYFSDNLLNKEQVQSMLSGTQEFARSSENGIGLFLSVDEEGGTVARAAEKLGTTAFNDMAYYGEKGFPALVYEMGQTIGSDLSELGFNLDFAPVADVNLNPDNELGNRIFSGSAPVVGEMTSNFVRGIQEKGVFATLKHFPGLGAGDGNTHSGSVLIKRTYKQLKEDEFIAFKGGIEAGAGFVMVGHQITSGSKDDLPGCMSKKVITDWLRGDLGFSGIVITDAMAMGAITGSYSCGEAAVMAVEAGVDIILMPENLTIAAEAVTNAVNQGRISEERIDESVSRILSKKLESGIIVL